MIGNKNSRGDISGTLDKQWIEIDNQPQFRTIGSIAPGHNGVSASGGSNGKIYLEICQYTSGTPYVGK